MRRAQIDAILAKLQARGIGARLVYEGPAGYVAYISGSGTRIATQREAAAAARKGKSA